MTKQQNDAIEATEDWAAAERAMKLSWVVLGRAQTDHFEIKISPDVRDAEGNHFSDSHPWHKLCIRFSHMFDIGASPEAIAEIRRMLDRAEVANTKRARASSERRD
jgi:hypothetical protein